MRLLTNERISGLFVVVEQTTKILTPLVRTPNLFEIRLDRLQPCNMSKPKRRIKIVSKCKRISPPYPKLASRNLFATLGLSFPSSPSNKLSNMHSARNIELKREKLNKNRNPLLTRLYFSENFISFNSRISLFTVTILSNVK